MRRQNELTPEQVFKDQFQHYTKAFANCLEDIEKTVQEANLYNTFEYKTNSKGEEKLVSTRATWTDFLQGNYGKTKEETKQEHILPFDDNGKFSLQYTNYPMHPDKTSVPDTFTRNIGLSQQLAGTAKLTAREKFLLACFNFYAASEFARIGSMENPELKTKDTHFKMATGQLFESAHTQMYIIQEILGYTNLEKLNEYKTANEREMVLVEQLKTAVEKVSEDKNAKERIIERVKFDKELHLDMKEFKKYQESISKRPKQKVDAKDSKEKKDRFVDRLDELKYSTTNKVYQALEGYQKDHNLDKLAETIGNFYEIELERTKNSGLTAGLFGRHPLLKLLKKLDEKIQNELTILANLPPTSGPEEKKNLKQTNG